MGDSEEDSTVLVMIVETAPSYWGSVNTTPDSEREGGGLLDFQAFVEQLLVYINAFLLLNEDNRLAIFCVHDNKSVLLYESAGLKGKGKQTASAESRASVCSAVVTGLQALGASSEGGGDSGKQQPALSGTLSRALCYLNSLSRRGLVPKGAAATASKPRLLVLQGSPDVQSQYIAFMNSIFSAQKAEVVIDACMLGRSDSSFLQQAVHLTKGVYLRPPRPSALLQYLLTVFTADTQSRSFLQLPKPTGVDFRASCFCHKRSIDLGYVCSVCLSIFCEGLSECSTCGSAFSAKRAKLQATQASGSGAGPSAGA
eukprot:jgi/Tetstr1/454641/TSEL_041533.t1